VAAAWRATPAATAARPGQRRARGDDHRRGQLAGARRRVRIGYRRCELKTDASSDGDEWLRLGAHFKLPKATRESRAIHAGAAHQAPPDAAAWQLPNAGSVFATRPRARRRKLIQFAGPESTRSARARLEKHANFIVNPAAPEARDTRRDPARAGGVEEKTHAQLSPKCASLGGKESLRKSPCCWVEVAESRDIAMTARLLRPCARKGSMRMVAIPPNATYRYMKRDG